MGPLSLWRVSSSFKKIKLNSKCKTIIRMLLLKSSAVPPEYEVPQGSALRPILFFSLNVPIKSYYQKTQHQVPLLCGWHSFHSSDTSQINNLRVWICGAFSNNLKLLLEAQTHSRNIFPLISVHFLAVLLIHAETLALPLIIVLPLTTIWILSPNHLLFTVEGPEKKSGLFFIH